MCDINPYIDKILPICGGNPWFIDVFCMLAEHRDILTLIEIIPKYNLCGMNLRILYNSICNKSIHLTINIIDKLIDADDPNDVKSIINGKEEFVLSHIASIAAKQPV